jgi:deazaflavin-dependent oxidoreductase (nitroreductase family)
MSDEPKEILRKEPGPVGRWFFRAPVNLYRLGLGGLMGRRMVMIEHTGRTSGLPRQTVLESVRYDEKSIDVAAAWGTKSDWYRNLEAEPRLEVSSGGLRGVPATSSVLDEKTAESVFAGYTEAHPKSARALNKTVGLPLDDPAQMAATVPLVRLTIDAPDAASS